MTIPAVVGQYGYRVEYANRFSDWRNGPLRVGRPLKAKVTTHRAGFVPALQSMKDDLLTEYATRGGGGESFSWTPPHGSSETVRFLGDELTAEKVTPNTWRAAVEIEGEPDGG